MWLMAFSLVVALAAVALVWGCTRRWGDTSATARMRSEGRKTFRVVVVAGKAYQESRACPAEESLHVLSRQEGHLVLSLRDLTGPGTRHFTAVGEDGTDSTTYDQLLQFSDDSGGTLLVGPTKTADWPRVQALFAGPRQPAMSRWRLLRVSFPTTASVFALLGLAGVALVNLIWWTGHDVPAEPLRMSDETCTVEWFEGGVFYTADVDCFEDAAYYGNTVVVRALAGPLKGLAWDTEGTFGTLASIGLGVAVVALAVGAGVAVRRAARPLRPLTLLDYVQDAPPRRSADSARAELAASIGSSGAPVPSGWLEDVTRVAERDDWASGIGSPPSRWRVLFQELLEAVGLAIVVGLFIGAQIGLGAAADDGWTSGLRWALLSSAGIAVVVLAGGLVLMGYDHGRRPTQDWAFITARVNSAWNLLLIDKREPQWRLTLVGQHHPGLMGTCRTREPTRKADRPSVHIDGMVWPTTKVERVWADMRPGLMSQIMSGSGTPSATPSDVTVETAQDRGRLPAAADAPTAPAASPERGDQRDSTAIPLMPERRVGRHASGASRDRVSVIAFAFSLVGAALVAVPLGIWGLVRTKAGTRGGRGFSVAALCVSAAWAVISAVAVFSLGILGDSEETASSDRPTSAANTTATAAPPTSPMGKPKLVNWGDLQPTMCVSRLFPLYETWPNVTVVDCRAEHEAEVTARTALAGPKKWPGDEHAYVAATAACTPALEQYVGVRSDDSRFQVDYLTALEAGWEQGDHTLICLAFDPYAQTLTGSMRGSHE